MTGYSDSYSGANRFCASQHSAGRVIWDTQEDYLDLKFIVGREGKSRSAFTGLHNPNSAVCNSAPECDGKLVSLLSPSSTNELNYFPLSFIQEWFPSGTALKPFAIGNLDM